jgi:protein-disulfide isomerase
MRLGRVPLLCAVILAGGATALASCDRAERALDAKDNPRIVSYLASHPEVIQDAINAYQVKQEAREVAQSELAIGPNRAALEHDPLDFVANPNGAITVTEFYDYRCPHCINAAPAVLKIIKDNPDVRFVFKEFPIFGETSDTAAAAAIAVKRAGGDYLKVYAELMAARPLTTEAVGQIIKEQGITQASLGQPAFVHDANDQLIRTRKLAQVLGVHGTPAFIVGNTMIPGERMDDVRAAISVARARKG